MVERVPEVHQRAIFQQQHRALAAPIQRGHVQRGAAGCGVEHIDDPARHAAPAEPHVEDLRDFDAATGEDGVRRLPDWGRVHSRGRIEAEAERIDVVPDYGQVHQEWEQRCLRRSRFRDGV